MTRLVRPQAERYIVAGHSSGFRILSITAGSYEVPLKTCCAPPDAVIWTGNEPFVPTSSSSQAGFSLALHPIASARAMEPTITVHRTMGRGLQIFALVFVVVLGAVAIQIPHWMPRVWAFICALIGLNLLFFRETQIDIERRVATEVTKFLGFIQVSQRERAFSDFQAVRCFRKSSDAAGVTWYVALVPGRGHEIWVRQFTTGAGEDCPTAQDFARDLWSPLDWSFVRMRRPNAFLQLGPAQGCSLTACPNDT